MGNCVSQQLRQLLLCIAFGAAAALIYDLFRAARLMDRRDKVMTHLLDGLFAAALLFSALFLALQLGQGQLRLFMVCGALLGAVVWFWLFSPLLRPIWALWCAALWGSCQLLAKPLRFFLLQLQKGASAAKKGFSFLRTWGTMKQTHQGEEGAAMAQKNTKTKKRRKSSPLLLLVLAVLIVVLAVQVVNVYSDLSDAKAQESALNDALNTQQQENDALRADLEKKDDENFIKALARELLGLAEEGERIFYDVNE